MPIFEPMPETPGWRRQIKPIEDNFYRTNVHHTLKKKPLRDARLRDFIDWHRPGVRYNRRETLNEAIPGSAGTGSEIQ
jgi:hypothetical protein